MTTEKFPIPPALKNYTGNKSQCYRDIINHVPKHMVRYEPFVGSGIISSKLAPFDDENMQRYGGDVDRDVTTAWNQAEQCAWLKVVNVQYQYALQLLNVVPWDTKGTFIYMDPPYMRSSRSTQTDMYKHDWQDSDHIAFLNDVKNISPDTAYCMISHYPCELYDTQLTHWHKHTFKTSIHGGSRIEAIYMNYDIMQLELHTYAYYGHGLTARQAFLRKANRWVTRFKNLSLHERHFLLQHMTK